jgi:hypothetical protein
MLDPTFTKWGQGTLLFIGALPLSRHWISILRIGGDQRRPDQIGGDEQDGRSSEKEKKAY